ncbi:Lysine-specific demethylase 8 [Coelomomyces lativittatus]|nr:Lysine-specific demethylase 8 [Coelomomyces lativittatus]KAJ1517427.1 Lysine-specific demethylase 8 [Coelomomyces lativittatus]
MKEILLNLITHATSSSNFFSTELDATTLCMTKRKEIEEHLRLQRRQVVVPLGLMIVLLHELPFRFELKNKTFQCCKTKQHLHVHVNEEKDLNPNKKEHIFLTSWIPFIFSLQGYFKQELNRLHDELQPSHQAKRNCMEHDVDRDASQRRRTFHQVFTFINVYLDWCLHFLTHLTTDVASFSPSWTTLLIQSLNRLDLSLLLTGYPSFHQVTLQYLNEVHACLPKLSFQQDVAFSSSFSCSMNQKPNPPLRKFFPNVYEPTSFPYSLFLTSESTKDPWIPPFVLRKAVVHWPACEKWTLNYLSEVAGYRLVPIEIGHKYTDPTWSMTYMSLYQYIQQSILHDLPSIFMNEETKKKQEGGGSPSMPAPTKKTKYLAQFELFRYVPSLAKDVGYPEIIFAIDAMTQERASRNVKRAIIPTSQAFIPSNTSTSQENEHEEFEAQELTPSPPLLFTPIQRHVWIGPPHTVTPFHHDGPLHNVFVQLQGSKRIFLIPPGYQKAMQPYPEDTCLRNTSQLDFDFFEEDPSSILAWIQQEKIQGYECILEEGDVLYIPPRWWHYVKSLTISMSLSFWW